MALTKIGKEGITGVSNAANATFLTATSAEGVTLAGTLAVTGVHTVGTNAVATSEGGAATINIAQGLAKAFCLGGNDASLTNSFNISGGTDNGTGDYTYAFSNNFGNNFLSASGNCVSDENVILVFTQDALLAASYRVECRNDSTGDQDEQTTANICGDLA